MPNRIEKIFKELLAQKRSALMPFITAGYPSMKVTESVIGALEEAGASIIELGIPFSDPIADGPVIAASMHQALLSGVTPKSIFELVRKVRPTTEIGLIAMVSDSIIERIGAKKFISDATDAGFDGLIVPDIDILVAEKLRDLAVNRGMSFSLLIAPTTSQDRIKQITALSTGFIYVLARVGITGESHSPPDIAPRIDLIRQHTNLPIAVGFGICTPQHVAAVTEVADAAIVGSALVRRMGESDDPVAAAQAFVSDLAGSLCAKA